MPEADPTGTVADAVAANITDTQLESTSPPDTPTETNGTGAGQRLQQVEVRNEDGPEPEVIEDDEGKLFARVYDCAT